jgi:hypothetical protein
VWLEALGRESIHLGTARTQLEAYDLTSSVDGLVRVGNWVPAYGPVNQCRITVPKDWSSSPAVSRPGLGTLTWCFHGSRCQRSVSVGRTSAGKRGANPRVVVPGRYHPKTRHKPFIAKAGAHQ